MENKIYQRAVTPTIDNSSVRGKVITYSNSNNRNRQISGHTTNKSSLISPRNIAQDLNIKGSKGISPVSNNINLRFASENFEHISSLSVLPRFDLVPLCEDLPQDGIIFAKIRSQPDSLVVFRTPEERLKNPERLNLDRRQLNICPILEQEQRLRLLNFQNNNIKFIQNLENLPNLIFLDLYNNKISSLDGPLSQIKGLRVLMAGKNKISIISNLSSLKKLDVLDLHSNEIRSINGLDGLTDLRVLNLAGNKISTVNNLSSLSSLTELNLRRNCIEQINGLNQLPALQRIFLSHNLISTLDNVSCLFAVSYLIELSLDGNPVAESDPLSYRARLILGIKGLRHLDLKRVTDEERASVLSILNSKSKEEDQEKKDIFKRDLNNNYFEKESSDVEDSSISQSEKNLLSEVDNSESSYLKKDISQFPDDQEERAPVKALLEVESISLDKTPTTIQNESPENPLCEGLASLARTGNISQSHSLFDLEIIGPDEKALIAVGEAWEWTQNKRLLSNVVEASFLHMKKETIVSKFSSNQIFSLPALKTIRFVNNNFQYFRDVEFISTVFGDCVESVIIMDNPISNGCSPKVLKCFLLSILPKLKYFNGTIIEDDEREELEKEYKSYFKLLKKRSKYFSDSKYLNRKLYSSIENSKSSKSKHFSPIKDAHDNVIKSIINGKRLKENFDKFFDKATENIIFGLFKEIN